MLVTVVLLLLLGFLLRLLLPYKWTSFKSAAMLKNIPGPIPYPIVGNMLELNIPSTEFLPKLLNFSRQFGRIWKVDIIGLHKVFLLDPDDIELVMKNKNYITKSTDYEILHAWFGAGLITSTGEQWAKHRRILTPAFHFKILESYVPIFNKHCAVLVDKLASLVGEKYVEINELLTLCTLDIISETAMGVAINAQQGEHADYVKAVKRMREVFNNRQLSFWLHHPWSYILSITGREEARLVKTLHQFTESIIKEKKAELLLKNSKLVQDVANRKTKRHRTFLDTLLEVAEESNLSETYIREEVDTFMFGGHDTTSAAICWSLYLLGRHHDVQDKVMDEMREIFGTSDREPDYNDLQNMKYLEQVIKEALRLYPSVPVYSRGLGIDLKLNDFVIPAGTNITILPYVLHRDPTVFPDPEKFNPDHFLPDRVQGRHPYAYLPFSAGPRNCIGQRFALLEEKAVLSGILRRLRVTSLDSEEDIQLLLELVLRPSRDLRVRFEPRG